MRLCLQHPLYGYYQSAEVFGRKGDFVTSPEMGPLFADMMTVWLVSSWERLGKPASFNLVELGPGRGTLMRDILRTSRKFPDFHKAISVHLVENSPLMRARQRKRIGVMQIRATGKQAPLRPEAAPASAGTATANSAQQSTRKRRTPSSVPLEPRNEPEPAPLAQAESTGSGSGESGSGGAGALLPEAVLKRAEAEEGISAAEIEEMGEAVVSGRTLDGISVNWHWAIEEVPRQGPLLVIAHEFLDALPVHQFQYTEHGWRERLVDVERDPNGPHWFRFVLAPTETPATAIFMRDLGPPAPPATTRQYISRHAAARQEQTGGMALSQGDGSFRPAVPNEP